MDHAAQMAAARELRASFSSQSSNGSRRPGRRNGGSHVYNSSSAFLNPQRAVSRLAMSQHQSSTDAGVSAPVGAQGNSRQTLAPHLRPAVGLDTVKMAGAAQSHNNSDSVAVNPSQATPPHPREPVGHAPKQPVSFPQNVPPHLRGPVEHAPEKLAGLPPSIPSHLRVSAGSSTQQADGTGGFVGGGQSGAKSPTGDNPATANRTAPGNSQASANGLGGLQNSQFAHNTQPTLFTPFAQTSTLKDTETAGRVAGADSHDYPPVDGQSTGQHIRCSAQYAVPPHLRFSACVPARPSRGADTAGSVQGGSAIFNFCTGATQADNIFNFQAGNSKVVAGNPHEFQNLQFEKADQPSTSSTVDAINITAPRANSAANAGIPGPVDHSPNISSSQPLRGHGGLNDSRFASKFQLGPPTPRHTTLFSTPNAAANSSDNHFDGTSFGVDSHDGQQRHGSKNSSLPAKEAPAFAQTAAKPAMAPSITRPGLLTPEPDNKGDDLGGDVEMLDAEGVPVTGDATKTYGGVLQSRWAPQAGPDTKALQANALDFRRNEPTWLLARLVHPTPTPARFHPSQEHERWDGDTLQSLDSNTTKQSHINQTDNVKESTFGGIASSRFA